MSFPYPRNSSQTHHAIHGTPNVREHANPPTQQRISCMITDLCHGPERDGQLPQDLGDLQDLPLAAPPNPGWDALILAFLGPLALGTPKSINFLWMVLFVAVVLCCVVLCAPGLFQ